MKKVMLILAAVATMALVAACGNNQAAQEQNAEEATECCEGECSGNCENCEAAAEEACEGECANCENAADSTAVAAE